MESNKKEMYESTGLLDRIYNIIYDEEEYDEEEYNEEEYDNYIPIFSCFFNKYNDK